MNVTDLPGKLAALERRRPTMFCVNDGPAAGDPAERARALVAFLERCFPVPSTFEN